MMNQLIAMNAEMTMSSLDFMGVINSERVAAGESAHEPRKFLAKVVDELDLDETGKKFRLNSNQTESAYYDLTMDQMMLVGMRESKTVRRNVLSKLKQMEIPKVPQTYAAALLEAGRLAMDLEQSQQQLAIAAPKAEFVDRYMSAPETFGFRQVAKKLHMKENELRDFLMDNRVMYYLSGRLTAYANHVDAGRFEQVSGVAGNDHAYTQSKFTTKGVEWLAGEIAKSKIK
ncbi:MAG: phage antirepressor KilAC domain-containing protein [Aeromonadaceae bacterium]